MPLEPKRFADNPRLAPRGVVRVTQQPIPQFRRGEIKGCRSWKEGIEQLAGRGPIRGNEGFACYDDDGYVHLQVWRGAKGGKTDRIFEGVIGKVAVPKGTRPGEPVRGNIVERRVRNLINRAKGTRRKFTTRKSPSATGSDLYRAGDNLAKELELITRSTIGRLCIQARRLADALASDLARARGQSDPSRGGYMAQEARRKAAGWLTRVVRQLGAALDDVSREELDLLIGCLARVEHALGARHEGLERLRRAVAARLRPGGA
jgi:hypothetical protein